MKKILLVAILVAAAGGALYYFVEIKKHPVQQEVNPGLIMKGLWQVDSVVLSKKNSSESMVMMVLSLDSNFKNYTYDVKDDSTILKKTGDSILAENIRYHLKDSTGIVITNGGVDAQPVELTITTREKERIVLMDTDSSFYYFTRKK
jgi:hypothetical protein